MVISDSVASHHARHFVPSVPPSDEEAVGDEAGRGKAPSYALGSSPGQEPLDEWIDRLVKEAERKK
jgi:hypothetical protein